MKVTEMGEKNGQMSESLLLGGLLALAGGFFDAYTYLCRGGVFANAQTGNIVLFGLELAERQWLRALTYLLPILAFALGVVAAELVKRRGKREHHPDGALHWRQTIVLAEIVILAVVAFAPQELNTAVNISISFVCAMQVETFRKVRGSAFATTMCTGNLRSGTEQLVLWWQNGDRKAARKARHYYAIILWFIVGAALGALCTDAWGERALLLTCAPLLAVFGLMFREEESHTFR